MVPFGKGLLESGTRAATFVPLPLEEQLERFPYDFKRELEPLHGGVADQFAFRLCHRFGQASGGLFDFRLAFGKSLFAHRLLFSMAGFRRIAFSNRADSASCSSRFAVRRFIFLLERFAVVSGFFLGEAIRMPNQDITGVLFALPAARCAKAALRPNEPCCARRRFLESTKWRAGVRIRIISGSAARRYLHADTMAFVQDNAGGTKIDVERKDVAGFQQFFARERAAQAGTKLAFTQVEGAPIGIHIAELGEEIGIGRVAGRP